MPNAMNNQYQFRKIKKIQLWNDDPRDHNFSNTYVYFSFYSSTGMIIHIKPEFEEDKNVKKRSKNLYISTGNYDNENDIEDDQEQEHYNKLVARVLSRNTRSRTTKHDDYIKQNIRIAANWNQE